MKLIDFNQRFGTADRRRLSGIVVCICTGWLVASCSGPVAIGKIVAEPTKYDGKTVTVEGEVSGTQSLLLVKFYTLQDETGKITIVTEEAMPNDGATKRVKGKVIEALSIADKSLLVIRENRKD